MSYNGDVIKYPREVTVFAAVCAVIFCVLGIAGKYHIKKFKQYCHLTMDCHQKNPITPTKNIVINKKVCEL